MNILNKEELRRQIKEGKEISLDEFRGQVLNLNQSHATIMKGFKCQENQE